MAIETVTSANLAEYVGKRRTSGSEIATPEQVEAAAKKAAPAEKVAITTGEDKTPDAPPDPGTQTPKKEGKKDSFQERINELTREKKELDEFAHGEYEARLQAQRRIDELETQDKSLTPKTEAPKQELKVPDPKAFTDQSEYDKAVKAYQDAVIDARVEEKLKQERERERLIAQEALMRERVAQAEKDIADFRDVIEAADRNPVEIPLHVRAAIMESELGPQIAYHLAKNPDEARRVFGLTPAKALLALGKLETQYAKAEKTETPSAPTPPETTRAPVPMSALKVSEGTVPTDLAQPMPFKDYKYRRIEEIRRKRH